MRVRWVFLSFLVLRSMAGQSPSPGPVTLEAVRQGLANPDFIEVPLLTEQIQIRGIAFPLGAQQLGDILQAAGQGKRDPRQIASLILTCFARCQDCRAGILSPMTENELKNLIKWGFTPPAALQEARVRGVKDLEISESEAHVLHEAGASDELVRLLIPDDKVPTIPLAGYTVLTLKRAEDYDPTAAEGWLKVTAELPPNSQSEFVFKHTGLFVRAVSGGDPTDVGSYFNKPAPRNTAAGLVDMRCTLENLGDEKRIPQKGKSKTKETPVIESSYLGADSDGRQAFRIVLTNKEISARPYSFTLRWRVLTTPKTSTASK